MQKNQMIVAAAAAVLLIGTTNAAVATGQGPSQGSGNDNSVVKVNVSIVHNNNANNAGNASRSGNNNGNVAANTSTNTNTGTNTNTSTNASGSSASAGAAAVAGANASASADGGDSGGASDVTVEGDDTPASSAAPIFLSTGDDVCMGSGGVGVQNGTLGLSLGSTWRDENCVMLKNARELKNQGHDKAAKARLCMNEDNALAFELAGEPCPRALESTQAALARIREWNPDYQRAAAAAPVQLAALDAAAVPADDAQVAVLPPAPGDADAELVSGGFGGFVAAIKAFFGKLASGAYVDDAPADGGPSLWDMPE